MKAYLSRNKDGVVTSGWLLREGISIHSTMCRLRRTQPDNISVEDAAPETVIRAASPSRTETRAAGSGDRASPASGEKYANTDPV